MATTITTVLAGKDTYICTVAVTNSETTSGNIAHGLGLTPKEVVITPVTAVVASSALWAATTIDGTNIVLTRDATGASVADTVRVVVRTPHSIGA